jgi:hypothetical protein
MVVCFVEGEMEPVVQPACVVVLVSCVAGYVVVSVSGVPVSSLQLFTISQHWIRIS